MVSSCVEQIHSGEGHSEHVKSHHADIPSFADQVVGHEIHDAAYYRYGMDDRVMDHHGHIDHSGINHGDTEHGGVNYGGMDSMCSMSMVWNTDPTNLCLVFKSWRITSPTSLSISLLTIVALGVFYEWLRLQLRHLDRRLVPRSNRAPGKSTIRRSGRRISPGAVAGSTHRKIASANNKGVLISNLSEGDAFLSPRRFVGPGSSADANSASGAESDSPFLVSGQRGHFKRGNAHLRKRDRVSAL